MYTSTQKRDPSEPAGLGIQSIVRPGFFRTILLWFIAISLIPLTIVSFINYQRTYNTLRDKAKNDLIIAAESKADQIQHFFRDTFTILLTEARRNRIVTMLKDLRRSFKAMGAGPAEFVKTPEWGVIAGEYEEDVGSFLISHDFYDFLVVDVDGNILFTDKREPDLGGSIFTGEYSKGAFGESCRSAFENETPVLSDFERDRPADSAPACFLITLIHDENENKIGLAAVRLNSARIDRIMQSRSGLGRGGETYLVGHDLRMRSNSVLDDVPSILGARVETEQARLWRKQHIDRASHAAGKEEGVGIYTGRKGLEVLGLHKHIEIAGARMAVMAEIPASEAFEAAVEQRNTSLIWLVLTTIVVIVLAFIIAERITQPVKRLAAGVRQVAGGDLDHEIRVKARGEIGELVRDFNDMVKTLRSARDTTRKWTWIKTGQTDLNDCIHAEEGMEALCQNIISFLTEYLEARVGAIYVVHGKGDLELTGSYALGRDWRGPRAFKPGEGLIGQAAVDKKIITISGAPDHYIKISSALGESTPRTIMVLPIVYDREVTAVIELGSFNEFSDMQLEFLNQVSENIAIAVNAAQSRQRLQDLLEKTEGKETKGK